MYIVMYSFLWTECELTALFCMIMLYRTRLIIFWDLRFRTGLSKDWLIVLLYVDHLVPLVNDLHWWELHYKGGFSNIRKPWLALCIVLLSMFMSTLRRMCSIFYVHCECLMYMLNAYCLQEFFDEAWLLWEGRAYTIPFQQLQILSCPFPFTSDIWCQSVWECSFQAGAQRRAAQLGIAIVAPDTSPSEFRRFQKCA